jgi:hypothetical protein
MSRQQRLQPRPFRITQVMPFQPVIIHSAIQAETPIKIYGTRPSRPGARGGGAARRAGGHRRGRPSGAAQGPGQSEHAGHSAELLADHSGHGIPQPTQVHSGNCPPRRRTLAVVSHGMICTKNGSWANACGKHQVTSSIGLPRGGRMLRVWRSR